MTPGLPATSIPATSLPATSGSPAAPAPPSERGTLQIPERVVQRIAAQAASEVAAAGGRTGGILGIGARTDLAARPRVQVVLTRDSADLRIELALGYPASIRTAVAQVREHVGRRVEHLTGIAVHRIDVDVVAASRAEGAPEGRLR